MQGIKIAQYNSGLSFNLSQWSSSLPKREHNLYYGKEADSPLTVRWLMEQFIGGALSDHAPLTVTNTIVVYHSTFHNGVIAS